MKKTKICQSLFVSLIILIFGSALVAPIMGIAAQSKISYTITLFNDRGEQVRQVRGVKRYFDGPRLSFTAPDGTKYTWTQPRTITKEIQ